jgi:hypothetical protein
MAKMSENARTVWDYVVANQDKDFTAKDIAEATGLGARSVNGIITQAFQKKGLMVRVEAELQKEDGTHEGVKLIKLTEDGKAFDPDAETATEAE